MTTPSQKTKIRESNEWITMRWHDEDENPHLPRILLVGDSIVNGHGTLLSNKLKDRYGVDCFCTSKIVCDQDFMSDLQVMLARHKYEIIIFNNGLHGRLVDDGHYASGLFDVLKELQGQTQTLIWRNSTPCYPGADGKENPWTEKVPIRNRLAAIEVAKLGLPTIDCYSRLQDQPELSCDGVHFHAPGYEIIVATIVDYLDAPVSCS
jgi:hypothetical protein